MSTRDVFTVVGTAVGAYFGNPQLGYAIGSAIGGAVDPQVIKGPSLGDISRQTSMEGIPRPIIWALSPPIAGNIIASSEPKIVRKRTRQGKGGPKVETEHVYRTYAIGVCEGPITRFVRVWRNNTLVYDVSEFPLLTHEDNVNFMINARFMLGAWDQSASPALELVFGVGTTPAHRGTAYMVMDDEELTDLRGAIPQYMFQVERCEGYFITSRPYPIEDTVALDTSTASRGGVLMEMFEDALETSLSLLGGNLYGTLEAYSNYPAEGFDTSLSLLSGNLYGDLVVYENYPPEAFDTSLSLLGGTLS